MSTQSQLDWIVKKLESRELQHATFKRDDDCIRLLITEVRLLVDTMNQAQAELAALRAENERLRAALESLYRKANSLADYYPEPGAEQSSYVVDAPEVFNDIRDTVLKALQPK